MSFDDVRNGDTSKFIVEKPLSTLDVVVEINKANLKNFIVLGYLDKCLSQHHRIYAAWDWLVLY